MFNDNIEGLEPSFNSNKDNTIADILQDNEGAMAKADLYKLANYSFKLFKKLNDDDQLEAWVQAKITKAADYIASVFHYLEYEKTFSEYGDYINDSDVYDDSTKKVLQSKLHEARIRIAELKNIQVEKLSLNKPNILNETTTTIKNKSVKPPVPVKPKSSKKTDDAQDKTVKSTEKPSAGLTKQQKSTVVKKAVAGKDIGEPGKKFTEVEKSAKKSGASDPKAVAAAAMWKGVKKAVVKESFRIGKPNKKYDGVRHGEFQTTISNPDFNEYDQNVPEEIDVTVKYAVMGGYSPASHDEPSSQEEVEITSIINDETGEEVVVPENTLNYIYDQIENNSENDYSSSDDSDYKQYRGLDEEGEEIDVPTDNNTLPTDDNTLESADAVGPHIQKIDLGDGMVAVFNSDTNDVSGVYMNGSYVDSNAFSPEQREMVDSKLQNYIQQQSREFSSWFSGIKDQLPQDQLSPDQLPPEQADSQDQINEMAKILKLAGM